MKQVAILSVTLLFLGLVGCGGNGFPPPVEVSGTVKYKGAPVEGATVTFLSGAEGGSGRSASGKTNAQGEYKLTTFNTDDGAIPGEYKVTIAKVSAQDEGSMDAEDPSAAYGAMMDASASGDLSKVIDNELPAKYGLAAESDLKRTVVAGQENVFGFDLE